MINPTKLRYWLGRSAFGTLDLAVSVKSLPARFPNGLHLEYDLQRFLPAPVTTIIDGGANVGKTALRFARYFNAATVHAFEPVSTTFEILEKSVKAHPRIACRKLALGDQAAELRISLSDNSELNSLLNPAAAPGAANSETVHVVRLDEYAEAQGLTRIDVLKLDLEGYELAALRGAGRLFERGVIQAVYSECGFVSNDRLKTSFGDLNETIQAHGFRFAGFYQTYRWGPHKCWVLFSNGLWLRA